jgi:hypothetical protein
VLRGAVVPKSNRACLPLELADVLRTPMLLLQKADDLFSFFNIKGITRSIVIQ